MPILLPGVLLLTLIYPSQTQATSGTSDCGGWEQCRQFALEAADRHDDEAFHDLAWRAVQRGPKHEASLMYLLARAQSRSGRPHDALVMLGRLADMGVVTDAATDHDLARVRALGAWAALKARMDEAAPTPATNRERTRGTTGRDTETAASVRTPAVDRRTAGGVERKAETTGPASRTVLEAGDAARFASFGPPPAGIAYDAVSRRFVVAGRETRKLSVVDEFSHHVATLSGAQADFGDIAALEIDAQQGNLWVVSSTLGTAARTTLHKLQLVSGRVLATFGLPEKTAAGRFVDVAVSSRGTVFALDDGGKRVFRLRPGSQTLESAASMDADLASIAPGPDGEAYVAHRQGINLVDLSTGASTVVTAAAGVDLSELTRIRACRGSLVGIQMSDGSGRAVRIALDRSGRRATSLEPIDPNVSSALPTAITVVGDVVYYLATTDAETIVRKVRLTAR